MKYCRKCKECRYIEELAQHLHETHGINEDNFKKWQEQGVLPKKEVNWEIVHRFRKLQKLTGMKGIRIFKPYFTDEDIKKRMIDKLNE